MMRNLMVPSVLALVLASCGGQSGDLPVIRSFTASDRVLAAGETSTLTWEVENATSLRLTADTGAHVGDVTGQSRADVTHGETTVHTLTASSAAGSVSKTVTVNVVLVSPERPTDVPGGAPNATLEDAAVYAWRDFIALNWPAQAENRDVADTGKTFGSAGPLVWETFRHKMEVYPGTLQEPHGPGYNSPPQYLYNPTFVGTEDGAVAPCSGETSGAAPYHNLDEQSEIGLDQMFAGSGPGGRYSGQQLLYEAKANRVHYDYVVPKGWYYRINVPFDATAQYVTSKGDTPPPGSTTLVSFPNGSTEMKAAWRKLTPEEAASGRFYTAPVRYYQRGSGGAGKFCYVDEASGWGLVGLHLIHKTPSAPYFTYATFEQADNLKDESGNPVEDENGTLLTNQNASPLEPMISSQNATPTDPQVLTPKEANSTPGSRLFYVNTPGDSADPQGTISVNRRVHTIPEAVVDANRTAHQAITAYNEANGLADSPWNYYKLVNVQYKPIDKPTPGQDYAGPDAATYYQANIVLETDYNLQNFSGSVALPGPGENLTLEGESVVGLVSDFDLDGKPLKNLYYGGHGFNMGGCMGCHGTAQAAGADSSFLILASGVFNLEPDVGGPQRTANLKKYAALLARP